MPWNSVTTARLTAPHEHTVTVEIERPSGARIPVQPLRGGGLSITLDETTAPHVRATVEAVADEAVVLFADPLNLSYLVVTAGYRWADGTTEADVLARLPITSRITGRPANTVSITAASVETLAMNYHYQWFSGSVPIYDTLGDLFRWMAQHSTALSNRTVAYDFPGWADTTSYTRERLIDYTIELGDNNFDVASEVGGRLGFKLYGDNLGRWALRNAQDTDAPGLGRRIAPGELLISSESTAGVTTWANSVTDVYEWADSRVTARAALAGGPYGTDNAPAVVSVNKYDKGITAQAAQEIATRRLRKLMARRDAVVLETVATYATRPNNRLSVRLPTWTADREMIVSAVTFTPGTGRMKLTMRPPVDTTAVVTIGE